ARSLRTALFLFRGRAGAFRGFYIAHQSQAAGQENDRRGGHDEAYDGRATHSETARAGYQRHASDSHQVPGRYENHQHSTAASESWTAWPLQPPLAFLSSKSKEGRSFA